jgi:hypothetical protein
MPTQLQTPGDGISRPVIPLQNTEPEIEIVEDDEAARVQAPADFPHDATDTERAGTYGAADDDDEPAAATEARTGHAQQGDDVADAAAGETPEQLSARQRRRQRDRAARAREQQELQRLRAENAQLRQGQQVLDTRLSSVEQAGIEGQIAQLESEIQRANSVMKRAMAAQNGDDFVQAQEIRDQFRDQVTRLKMQKDQQARQAQQAAQPTGTMASAEVLKQNYQRIFLSRHPWFNPRSNDKDSQAILRLDAEMLAEGKQPSESSYWLELENRVREDLPHLFRSANDANGQQQEDPGRQQNGRGKAAGGRASGGPRMPGNGSGSSGGGGGAPIKFHLSALRKKAMIDSGAWEDPERKKRQIAYYMKWDKENPST